MPAFDFVETFNHSGDDATFQKVQYRLLSDDLDEYPEDINPLVTVFYFTSTLPQYENMWILNYYSRSALISLLNTLNWRSDLTSDGLRRIAEKMRIDNRMLGRKSRPVECAREGGFIPFDVDQSSFHLHSTGNVKLPVCSTEQRAKDSTTLIENFSQYWARFLMVLDQYYSAQLVAAMVTEGIFDRCEILPTGYMGGTQETSLPADQLLLGAFIMLVGPTKTAESSVVSGFLTNRLKTLSIQLPITISAGASSYLYDFMMLAEVRIRFPELYTRIYHFVLNEVSLEGLGQILQSQWKMILEWAEMASFEMTYTYATNPCTGAFTLPVIVEEAIEVEKAMATLKRLSAESKINVKYYALCKGHPPEIELKNFPHIAYSAYINKLRIDPSLSWDNFKFSVKPTKLSVTQIENWTTLPLTGTGVAHTLSVAQLAWLESKGISQAAVDTTQAAPPINVNLTNPSIRRPKV